VSRFRPREATSGRRSAGVGPSPPLLNESLSRGELRPSPAPARRETVTSLEQVARGPVAKAPSDKPNSVLHGRFEREPLPIVSESLPHEKAPKGSLSVGSEWAAVAAVLVPSGVGLLKDAFVAGINDFKIDDELRQLSGEDVKNCGLGSDAGTAESE